MLQWSISECVCHLKVTEPAIRAICINKEFSLFAKHPVSLAVMPEFIVVEIAKHLEGELLKRGIFGRSGALDWETIKKEALTGITGRKRGENFKRQKGNPHRMRRSPKVQS